jgi:hypothetical protein
LKLIWAFVAATAKLGDSRRLSLTVEVGVAKTEFGAESGEVVEVAHPAGVPDAITPVHPAGSADVVVGVGTGVGVGVGASACVGAGVGVKGVDVGLGVGDGNGVGGGVRRKVGEQAA